MNVIGRDLFVAVEITLVAPVHAKIVVDVVVAGSIVIVETTAVGGVAASIGQVSQVNQVYKTNRI